MDFVRGLSRDELECLAEFQGACMLEALEHPALDPYELVAEFFEPQKSERWHNEDDRAHKTFIVLAWLKQSQPGAIRVRIHTR